ncbi:MAG: YHS domain-containing protein [Caldilineaceae bacterium]|nr:YHS domain-containing protein [Caldilineaceae bacterium]
MYDLQQPQSSLPICPICGAKMQPNQIAACATYLGHTYLFCSQACYLRFYRRPEVFLVALAHAEDPHLGYPCPNQST